MDEALVPTKNPKIATITDANSAYTMVITLADILVFFLTRTGRTPGEGGRQRLGASVVRRPLRGREYAFL
jgi:hypothetical protein